MSRFTNILKGLNSLKSHNSLKGLILIVLAIPCLCGLTAMGGARVHWLQEVWNFGAISEDAGAATCTFRYVNVGDSPLIVISARANCGCTTPKYSTAPIAPGDTAGITVSYDPGGRAGRFSKYVFVDMNTTPRRSQLEVKGTVIGNEGTLGTRYPVHGPAGLRLRQDMVAFGPMEKGHAKTVFYEAYNQTSDTLEPRWPSLPKWLLVTARPQRVPPGEQVTFSLTFNTSDTPLYGLVSDSTQLCVGNDCRWIQLVGIVNEDFSRLTPGQRQKAPVIDTPDGTTIDLGTSLPASGTLKIKNRGQSPLLVRRVYSLDPGVECSVSSDKIKPGKETLVTVTARPEAMRGDILNARVALVTNDPDHPVTTIRVVGLK